VSGSVFERLTTRTGGRVYWAKTWQKQAIAFNSIREDIANSYTVAYYPTGNPNEGFRKLDVEVVSDTGKHYRIRARAGYRPHFPIGHERNSAASAINPAEENAAPSN